MHSLARLHRPTDDVWRNASLVRPERSDTWPLVHSQLRLARRRLEIAPGLRPRLPPAGTHMVDASAAALARLRDWGAHPTLGRVTALPFANHSFDLLSACGVMEHVVDDAAGWAELARVAAPGAMLMLAVPLHPDCWSPVDELAGRVRRYEPPALVAALADHGFTVEQSAPRDDHARVHQLIQRLVRLVLRTPRQRALWWYHRVIVPLAARLEPPLCLQPGMLDAAGTTAALLICRKSGAPPRCRLASPMS